VYLPQVFLRTFPLVIAQGPQNQLLRYYVCSSRFSHFLISSFFIFSCPSLFFSICLVRPKRTNLFFDTLPGRFRGGFHYPRIMLRFTRGLPYLSSFRGILTSFFQNVQSSHLYIIAFSILLHSVFPSSPFGLAQGSVTRPRRPLAKLAGHSSSAPSTLRQAQGVQAQGPAHSPLITRKGTFDSSGASERIFCSLSYQHLSILSHSVI